MQLDQLKYWEAIRLEPKIKEVIADLARAAVDTEGTNHYETYERFKGRIIQLVGFGAGVPELQTQDHYDAVMALVITLLPAPDESDMADRE